MASNEPPYDPAEAKRARRGQSSGRRTLSELGRRTALVAGLFGALSLVGCAEGVATAAEAEGGHGGHKTGTFVVSSPLKTDTQVTREFVCQIHSIQRIEVRALERGYLEETFVDEGQSVKAGQPMFQIMPRVYEAELNRARAEAETARIEYENTQLLAAKDVVSANELALSKAKLAEAQAEVTLSETHRDLTAIKAPFSGITGLLEARRGSLLEEGELLTTLSDNSTMWVYFNVTEAEYLAFAATPKAREQAQVRLVLANHRVFEHAGTIETVEADFNNETGTIAFRAGFPNPKGLLRHGATGKVLMTRKLEGALLIPQKATFEVLDTKCVFVVDEHGVVHQRRITVTEEMPHLYVVSGGLKAGERILLEGLRKVQDGGHVEVRYQDPAEVFKHLELPAD